MVDRGRRREQREGREKERMYGDKEKDLRCENEELIATHKKRVHSRRMKNLLNLQ